MRARYYRSNVPRGTFYLRVADFYSSECSTWNILSILCLTVVENVPRGTFFLFSPSSKKDTSAKNEFFQKASALLNVWNMALNKGNVQECSTWNILWMVFLFVFKCSTWNIFSETIPAIKAGGSCYCQMIKLGVHDILTEYIIYCIIFSEYVYTIGEERLFETSRH